MNIVFEIKRLAGPAGEEPSSNEAGRVARPGLQKRICAPVAGGLNLHLDEK
jgi:hypothetical protein